MSANLRFGGTILTSHIVKSEVPRIAYLDGLRGVAALMVLFAHLMISLFPAVVTFNPKELHTQYDLALGLSPLAVLWTGNFAVCIFFVLSGFVLSDFCQRTRLSFPAQLARRYCRLAVPMLLTSTIAWLLLHFGLYNNLTAAKEVTRSGWLSGWYGFDPNIFKMVKEALYGAFVKGHAKYNCNLWTMQLEIIGSAYVFVLFALLKNRYLRLIAVLWFMKLHYQGFYMLFAWGALLYDFQADLSSLASRLVPWRLLRVLAFLGAFVLALYLGGFPDTQPNLISPWYAELGQRFSALQWHMLAAMILVTIILQSSFAQRILACAAGRFLGKISFVLYLIHIPIICSFTSWVVYATRSLPYYQTALISALMTILTVVLVSNLLHRYVDQYTTAFSRWVGNTVDKRIPFEKNRLLVVEAAQVPV